MLPWLVLRMAAELNRYNRTAPAATRLRVRAVVPAARLPGQRQDEPGAAGVRLVYNNIIEQGYREIDAEAFQPVQVAAKSTHALAWVYVPGRHNGVTTGQQRPGLATAPTAPPAIPHERLAAEPQAAADLARQCIP